MMIILFYVTNKVSVCFVSGSWGEICEMLNRCGKRFEDATRKAECLADNVWHHREPLFFLVFFFFFLVLSCIYIFAL